MAIPIFMLYTAWDQIPLLILSSSKASKKKKKKRQSSQISGGSDSNESACNAGDQGSIPGLGRSPEETAAHSLESILVKCSCLDNPMDRGAWQVTVHGGHKESDMTE